MTVEDKNILVVEDEKPLREAIKIKLEKAGFTVVTAISVEQAKDYVEQLDRVDAIWLDHYLIGKEDGLDFVVWCKKEDNEKCKMVPIFVVSNTASADKVTSYIKLGVKEYIVKANHRLDEIIDMIMKSFPQGEK